MAREVSKEEFTAHRMLATQLEALYRELEKLAKKKPTEYITKMIAQKVNHILAKIREQVKGDEFLDAIETLPTDGNSVRFDESLIILGELRGIMDKQWNSDEYVAYRKKYSLQYTDQIM